MSQGFGGGGGYGRFPSINQGPTGMPIGPPNDPPGYYLGWPLANAAKRLAASLIDWVGFWVLAWFGVVAIGGTISAVGGDTAGQTALFPLLIVIYVLGYYNVGLQQSRTGQSWGKRMLGLRLVKMNELRPPAKLDLTFRPIIGAIEIFTGVGILSMLLSRYRQSFADRFSSTVVIDEARAGMTLPWALPADPVLDPGPPIPQEGVPRPEKRRRSEQPDPGPPPWAQRPGPQPVDAALDGDLPERELGDDLPETDDLPEREFGDAWPSRPRTETVPGNNLPVPGRRVTRDSIAKLDIPPDSESRAGDTAAPLVHGRRCRSTPSHLHQLRPHRRHRGCGI